MTSRRDIHPNDRALLYDLVDERLAPRAADELRRRLDDEPELRAAHDEIVDLRRRLAELPAPALPPDFLERVRARAGFVAALAKVPAGGAAAATTSVETSASPAAAPAPTADSATSVGEVRAAPSIPRLFAFARVAYAAAALLVVALGVVWWKMLPGSTSAPADRESARLDRGAREPAGASAAADAADRNTAAVAVPGDARERDAAKSKAVGDDPKRRASAEPRFGGPIGAVPPGLRTPTDDPSTVEVQPSPPNSAAGAASGTSEAGPGAVGLRVSAEESARIQALLAKAQARAASPSRPAANAVAGASDRPLLGDADDVLLVYADSLDAARAEVSLLVANARASRPLDASRVGPSIGRVDKKPAAPAAPGDPPATPASSDAVDSDGDGAWKVPGLILGAFVIELDEASLERLARSLSSADSVSPRGAPARQESDRAPAAEPGVDEPRSSSTPPSTPPSIPAPSAPSPAPAPSALPSAVPPGAPPEVGARSPGAPPEVGARSPGAPPEVGARSPGTPPEVGARSPGTPPEVGAPSPGAPPEVGARSDGGKARSARAAAERTPGESGLKDDGASTGGEKLDAEAPAAGRAPDINEPVSVRRVRIVVVARP